MVAIISSPINSFCTENEDIHHDMLTAEHELASSVQCLGYGDPTVSNKQHYIKNVSKMLQ